MDISAPDSPAGVTAPVASSRTSSGDSTERVTTATASPPLGVTNFTPMVERPVARKSSLIGLRTT